MTKTYTLAEQKENRKKWVKALRSGRYKQGKGRLMKTDGTHCCLGVGCRVARLSRHVSPTDPAAYEFGDHSLTTHPPSSFMDFVGLRSHSGTFIGEIGGSWNLIDLNDGGKSFSEIADIIESEPKGLFCESAQ